MKAVIPLVTCTLVQIILKFPPYIKKFQKLLVKHACRFCSNELIPSLIQNMKNKMLTPFKGTYVTQVHLDNFHSNFRTFQKIFRSDHLGTQARKEYCAIFAKTQSAAENN